MKSAAIARALVVVGAGGTSAAVWMLAGGGWALLTGSLWIVLFGLLGVDVDLKREAQRGEPPA